MRNVIVSDKTTIVRLSVSVVSIVLSKRANSFIECQMKLFPYFENMESKNKSLGATMNDLVNIVSPNWSVPSENVDEVFPGIFMGDEIAAKDVGLLQRMKMTHILNAAYSEKTSFLYVNTSQKYYRDRKFECNFLGLSAVDCPTYKLAKYFQQATDFIDLAVNFPQGKILVHCRQGVSRSATFVIIYLMLKKKMTAREAVTLIRKKRNIFPNKGFLKEICDFETQLVKSKHYDRKDEMNNVDLILIQKLSLHRVEFRLLTDEKATSKTGM